MTWKISESVGSKKLCQIKVHQTFKLLIWLDSLNLLILKFFISIGNNNTDILHDGPSSSKALEFEVSETSDVRKLHFEEKL